MIIAGCKEKRDNIEQWNIQAMKYQDVDLFGKEIENDRYKVVPLYLNYSKRKIMFFLEKRKILGDFRMTENAENENLQLTIKNSNDKRFNGKYLMRIDTLISSNVSLQLKLTIKNSKISIVGNRLEL